MSNDLVAIKINSLAEIEKMADRFVRSRLFGAETIDQAFSLMMVAHARGIHPAKAAMDYHIIQGRPALKADAMLAYFQESGGIVQWKVYTDTCVTGLFSHPRAGQIEPIEIAWTIEMASKIMTNEKGQRIPLSQKSTWKDYPRAMLRSRCISEGVRTVYPGIISGFYTEEEVSSFSENEKFNKAKPIPSVKVDVDKVDIDVIESTATIIEPAQEEEATFKRQILFEFKQKAAVLRDDYRRCDADEGCTLDQFQVVHNNLLTDWLNLCEQYKKEYAWFSVPDEWQEGMSKIFGIDN